MTKGDAGDILYEFFVLCIQLGGPMLIISMGVGILISILQAATQIHEQTVTFVPKLLVIGIVLVLTGDSMLEMMQDFFREILTMLMA